MTEAANFESFLRWTAGILGDFAECKKAAGDLTSLAESLNAPFSLAVCGRMKAGKSTLINSIIGRSLAVSDVEEATATLNWICYGVGEQTRQMIVHWKDGRSEPLPLNQISDWTGKSAEVRERIQKTSHLTFFAEDESLQRVQIVDTPGTGSAVEEHEVAREFLNPDAIAGSVSAGSRADAILYVVPPVGRESDIEMLELFRSGCMPNSGPYNSVCVLHKWDGIEVAASEDSRAAAMAKAGRLFDQIGDNVMAVIPVSAPLALAAKAAPDVFFDGLLKIISTLSEADFQRVIKTDERWDRDASRAATRKIYGLPWASFRLLSQLICKHKPDCCKAARRICLDYSGLPKLDDFLHSRIFSRTFIIKQFQALQRAKAVLEPVILKLQAHCQALAKDAVKAGEAAEALQAGNPLLAAWVSAKESGFRKQSEELHAKLLEIDYAWKSQQDHLEDLSLDLELCQSMDDLHEILPEHRRIIEAICNHLADVGRRAQLGSANLASLRQITDLLNYYQSQANRASRKHQKYYEHIVKRLEQAWTWHEQMSLGA